MTNILNTLPISQNINMILLVGIAVFLGSAGAKLFQRLRIPQIVGYVAVGILLGPVLKVISHHVIEQLEFFEFFALGIIGFLVGGELKKEIFVKFGKQVPAVLLFEGIAAFLLVGILTFLTAWFYIGWHKALAVAVVFAAICSATDPASTISVLWEYKARGPLTSMLTAIVTLDDALALTLYAIGISVAGVATGGQHTSLLIALTYALYEVFGSLAIGFLAGLVLSWILKRIHEPEKTLAFSLSTTLIVIGTAVLLRFDVILSSMALGVTLINSKSRKAQSCFDIMHRFSAPIYILFFILVGARFEVSHVKTMIWLLVAAYVAGSIIGKTAGSYLGCVYSGTVKTVRKYLGFCLYPQGGIAIGLLVMASNKFEPEISSIMLLVVIIGAFILQVIGPIGVKIGAQKAGELGLNVTEEDLLRSYKVGDVMDTETAPLLAGATLSEVIRIVSTTDSFYYPVVDSDNNLLGAVTMDGIRNTFATQELNNWLVALDIMEPVTERVTPDIALSIALVKAKKLDTEYLPVTVSGDGNKLTGLLSTRAVHRQLMAEVLAKQKEADNMYGFSST